MLEGILCHGRVRSKQLSREKYKTLTGLTCELRWIHDILIEMVLLSRLWWDYIMMTGELFRLYKILFSWVDKIYWSGFSWQEKYDVGMVEPKHASSTNQLVDLLTKPIRKSSLLFICNKLVYMMYILQLQVLCNKSLCKKEFRVKGL